MDFNPAAHQHNRLNPLTGQWVLVSPHRLLRPWGGAEEPTYLPPIQDYDPNNPLCPGSIRANGEVNPMYEGTFVFDNDFPAFRDHAPLPEKNYDPLFQYCGAAGKCRVICFHPRSSITLPVMTLDEILSVINVWIGQTQELGERFTWVQIFENKGETMGCSNPHPHCQVWASSFLPNEPRTKHDKQLQYFREYKKPLLLDYVQREIENEVRIVHMNDDWVVLVPFWAMWPYETMILPKAHVRRFYDLSAGQKCNLAEAIKTITVKYDNLFLTSFPYSMGWHGAPTGKYNNENVDHWVFHGIYYPPLLRSATVKKFMVGYEMLAQCQRDLTPEKAAEMLRNASNVHYLSKRKSDDQDRESEAAVDALKSRSHTSRKSKRDSVPV